MKLDYQSSWLRGSLRAVALLCLAPFFASAQSPSGAIVAGQVSNAATQSYLEGAVVQIDGTNRTTLTDRQGRYEFRDVPGSAATLVVSFVGYEPFEKKLTLSGAEVFFTVKLREVASELNTVVITAGSFEASDEKKMTMLKPLDIVTTAGVAPCRSWTPTRQCGRRTFARRFSFS